MFFKDSSEKTLNFQITDSTLVRNYGSLNNNQNCKFLDKILIRREKYLVCLERDKEYN